jgi:hypothetical protein
MEFLDEDLGLAIINLLYAEVISYTSKVIAKCIQYISIVALFDFEIYI